MTPESRLPYKLIARMHNRVLDTYNESVLWVGTKDECENMSRVFRQTQDGKIFTKVQPALCTYFTRMPDNDGRSEFIHIDELMQLKKLYFENSHISTVLAFAFKDLPSSIATSQFNTILYAHSRTQYESHRINKLEMQHMRDTLSQFNHIEYDWHSSLQSIRIQHQDTFSIIM